jgi:hypothetical protein
MMDEVAIDGDAVTLAAEGRRRDTQRRDALERVYAVHAGSEVAEAAADVALRVFRFADALWVLPWTTAGVAAAIAAIWPDPRQRAEGCWEAVIDELPRDWRTSTRGDRARPQAAAVLVLPASALPTWRIRHEGANSHFVAEHAFPFLDALIGGWFHQDFDIEGDTLAAVIAAFRRVSNADDWAETRADIARLLRRYDDAALPREFVRLFAPGIDAEAWCGSTRAWLTQIDELLRRP